MNHKHHYRIILACLIAWAMLLQSISFGAGENVTEKAAYAAAKPAFARKSFSIEKGSKKQLKIKNISAKNVKTQRFSSSNNKVAKVSKKGKVTALKIGKAKIRCKLQLKNGQKYNLACTVLVCKVKDKDKPEDKDTDDSATETPSPTKTPEITDQIYDSITSQTEGSHLSANGIPTIDNGVMRADLSAFAIQHEMGIGINLGNTMESCGSWINGDGVSSYEKAWGAPITTQAIISGMKAAGFDSLRIPVAWSNMIDESNGYTIDERYLNRVETIMNYALNEKMYVIVNIHYDSGWWAKFGSKKKKERTAAMEKYKAVWTQIANRYKEYSDYLIFEGANEEVGERLNSTGDYAGSGYYESESDIYKLVNQINQTFVDVVRGTGGNNSSRYLLIPGYNTDIGKTCDSRFVMPTDTLPGHLLISVHYYTPATYCLVEEKDNSWGYQANWGTSEDVAQMLADLQKMKIRYTDRGYPVVIGEYGVADTKVKGKFIRKKGRDLFFKTLCEYAVQNGMCPMLWNTEGIYHKDICKIANEVEAANYLAIAAATRASGAYVPAGIPNSFYWEGDYDGAKTKADTSVPVNFLVQNLGGCQNLTALDWSGISHPVLTIEVTGGAGVRNYTIGKTVSGSNSYYQYMDDKDAMMTGKWNTGKVLTLDLSTLALTGTDGLFISFDGSVGSEVKIQISNAQA